MRLAPLALILITWPCLADSTRPLREARSENREYRLLIERADPRGIAKRERVSAKESPAESTEQSDVESTESDNERPDGDGPNEAATESDAPGEGKRSRPEQRGIEARLVQVARGEDDREVWRAKLVNPIAPLRAFVHDHGTWVVTLDDYPNGGAQHALVVYDAEGQATHEFSLDELLPRADRGRVKHSGEKVEWMGGSRARFRDSDEFELRLRWGTTITIDLREGRVERTSARHEDGETADGDAETEEVAADDGDGSPEEILRERMEELEALAANSSDRLEVERLNLEAASVRDQLAAMEAVRSFGGDADVEGELTEIAQAALEREAAEAKVQELLARQAAGDTDPALAAQIAAAREQAEALRGVELRAASEVSKQLLQADGIAVSAPNVEDGMAAVQGAGNSAAAGLAVPMPNAAEHFNYVDWANQNATPASGDLTAQTALATAAKLLVPFEGDGDLLNRAMDGDAAALAAPEIRTWVDANRAAMDALAAARGHEYGGMPMRSDDGSMIGILLPNLSPWRQGIKASILDGKLLESEGRPQEAVDRYLGAMVSGSQFSKGPTLIEGLVGVASQAAGQEALLDSYANQGANLDYSSIAARMDAEVRGTRPISETFQNERAMVLDVIQRSFKYDAEAGSYSVDAEYLNSVMGMSGQGGLDSLMTGISLQTAGFDETVARANAHYDELTQAAQLPYQQAREAFSNLERQISDPAFKAQNPLLGALLPSLSRAAFLTTRNEAGTRAARLITELKAYQQTTGTLPDSLDTLGGRDFTIDPFTGQSFGFRREGSNFVVYSKGANGTDEGGVHDRRGETNDLVYWPRPPKDEPR